eukprot:TRINITY_DN67948_c0_g1_i10.p1 TRINITY_DN67948_c0_g1~~TRINITY_DN67948_c0_g1_i10.p1  ORF type:complete len:104 (+),score=6.60 TRINITY_DN67948_c0_g1_i10:1069-1380(+)
MVMMRSLATHQTIAAELGMFQGEDYGVLQCTYKPNEDISSVGSTQQRWPCGNRAHSQQGCSNVDNQGVGVSDGRLSTHVQFRVGFQQASQWGSINIQSQLKTN